VNTDFAGFNPTYNRFFSLPYINLFITTIPSIWMFCHGLAPCFRILGLRELREFWKNTKRKDYSKAN
jgi:hypothetical protein